MKRSDRRKRRRFLARAFGLASVGALAGCEKLSQTTWFPSLLGRADALSEGAGKLVTRKAMAQEFLPGDRSPSFRSNGTADPGTDDYDALVDDNFAGYHVGLDLAIADDGAQVAGPVDCAFDLAVDVEGFGA